MIRYIYVLPWLLKEFGGCGGVSYGEILDEPEAGFKARSHRYGERMSPFVCARKATEILRSCFRSCAGADRSYRCRVAENDHTPTVGVHGRGTGGTRPDKRTGLFSAAGKNLIPATSSGR